ncbi:class II lanthipeptide, LchA2/BrtA2 family [Flexivirga lutea]
MPRIGKDASTGYVSEEELLELFAPSEDVTGAGAVQPMSTAIACAISATVASATAISAAWGDGCPSTACTSRC